jgi:hypothetical protein
MRISINKDRLKEIIGTICKWIVFIFLGAVGVGLLVVFFIIDWLTTILILLGIAIICGYLAWGV